MRYTATTHFNSLPKKGMCTSRVNYNMDSGKSENILTENLMRKFISDFNTNEKNTGNNVTIEFQNDKVSSKGFFKIVRECNPSSIKEDFKRDDLTVSQTGKCFSNSMEMNELNNIEQSLKDFIAYNTGGLELDHKNDIKNQEYFADERTRLLGGAPQDECNSAVLYCGGAVALGLAGAALGAGTGALTGYGIAHTIGHTVTWGHFTAANISASTGAQVDALGTGAGCFLLSPCIMAGAATTRESNSSGSVGLCGQIFSKGAQGAAAGAAIPGITWKTGLVIGLASPVAAALAGSVAIGVACGITGLVVLCGYGLYQTCRNP